MNDKKDKDKKEYETTIDPYTGEEVPVAEDADRFIEIVPSETEDREGENYLLEEETSMDHLAADETAEEVADLSASYTENKDVEEDFEERQRLAVSGRRILEEELEQHHSQSPELSAGDLDADWRRANQVGEETVGGSVATPDQDIVEELGEAAGLTYRDDEPLGGEDKILERDRNRWELNPESAAEEQEDLGDLDEE